MCWPKVFVKQCVTSGLHQRKLALLQSRFHLLLPAPLTLCLHPDQLIDTWTVWQGEAAHSLIHEMQHLLKSRSAINTHSPIHVYTPTRGWKEKQSTGELVEETQEQHHSSSNLLESVLTHPELCEGPRRHFAHFSDDDESDEQAEDDRKAKKEEKVAFSKTGIKMSRVFPSVPLDGVAVEALSSKLDSHSQIP